MASFGYNATIRIAGIGQADVLPEHTHIRLTADRPESENSFSHPLNVSQTLLRNKRLLVRADGLRVKGWLCTTMHAGLLY